jgi:Domain of unknown function (DUF4189)
MKYVLLFLLFASYSHFAMAEGGCPPGTYPANPPATNVCYPFPDQGNNQSSQQPQARWETRWGGVATDSAAGIVAGVTGFKSKRQANKAALLQCREKGGRKCFLDITYYNGCVVLAVGSRGYNLSTAATMETTTQNGLKKCGTHSNDCRIVYADCSLPELIQ